MQIENSSADSYKRRTIRALQYTWGLWSVRRSDLQTVWCEGFDYVRPPYPDVPYPDRSGQWQDQWATYNFDQTDNYASALNYAKLAQQVGFSKLIYDSGLKYLYTEYRHWLADNSYQTSYHSLNDIKNEIDKHFREMAQGGLDRVTGKNIVLDKIYCVPYIDEPDDFGKVASPYIPACSQDPIINCPVVQEFKDLVDYAQQRSISYQRPLIIATSTPDIVQCCDPINQNCSNIDVNCRDDWPSYYYDSSVWRLMSSLYDTATRMSKILPAIQSNYPSQTVEEIINVFDRDYGCRNACQTQDIIDQINVNSRYTAGQNWFYQGDCTSFDWLVDGVSSQTQWQKLLDAIHSFGTRCRC